MRTVCICCSPQTADAGSEMVASHQNTVNQEKPPETFTEVHESTYLRVQAFKEEWKAWASKTTFHGVSLVFDSRASTARRILWFFIIGSMWVWLAENCWAQYNRYNQFRTFTQDTIRYESFLKFPAVTICNLNIIRNKTALDPRNKVILQNLFVNYPNKTELLEFPGEDFVKNFSLREALLEGSMQYKETFIDCVRPWNGDLRTCSPIQQFAGDDLCHTLNTREGNSTIVRLMFPRYEMYLVLWAGQDQYYITDGMAAGFKIMVHDADDIPDPNKAIYVGPGFMYSIALKKHEYTYLPSPVKAFGEKDCMPRENLPANYSILKCATDCRESYVYNICSCIGPSQTGNKRECNPLEIIDCYYDALNHFQAENIAEACACPLPCSSVEFKTTVTSALFPTANAVEVYFGDQKLPEEYKNYKDNVLQVLIFFEDKVVTQHQQVLQFSREDLISSIGGFFGLLIGASIVSIVELFELLAMSVFRCVFQRRI